jgi:hypothetical protein
MGEEKRRRDFYQNPEDRLGDAPVEQKYHDKMVAVAKAIDQFFNGDKHGDEREVGFVLMVFPFSDHEGRTN